MGGEFDIEQHEPVWADILDLVYYGGLDGRILSKITEEEGLEEADPHEITNNIPREGGFWELDKQAQARVLDEMEEVGLIDLKDGKSWNEISLTKKGFEVAHDRQVQRQQEKQDERQHRRQYKLNKGVALLTTGILFTGSIDVVGKLFIEIGLSNEHYFILIGVVVFILITLTYYIGKLEKNTEQV